MIGWQIHIDLQVVDTSMDNSALRLPHERLQHDSDQDPLAYSETQYHHLQAIQYYKIEEFKAE